MLAGTVEQHAEQIRGVLPSQFFRKSSIESGARGSIGLDGIENAWKSIELLLREALGQLRPAFVEKLAELIMPTSRAHSLSD